MTPITRLYLIHSFLCLVFYNFQKPVLYYVDLTVGFAKYKEYQTCAKFLLRHLHEESGVSPKMKQFCFKMTPHGHLMQPTYQILMIGNKLPMISNNEAHTYTPLYSTMIMSLPMAHSQSSVVNKDINNSMLLIIEYHPHELLTLEILSIHHMVECNHGQCLDEIYRGFWNNNLLAYTACSWFNVLIQEVQNRCT
ncbi:hypothetical protein BCV71DRAFT_285184 [Rhizopus microsporus]|uniref:Uncharacterized protein n=1 Tax=Rhizopus microsporus TaxID=58291 RepID=A0A1X0S2Q0_RHIZD|nr:hypothetical protein BCV71DRAFT_285184 [Rhizopus microsporus]